MSIQFVPGLTLTPLSPLRLCSGGWSGTSLLDFRLQESWSCPALSTAPCGSSCCWEPDHCCCWSACRTWARWSSIRPQVSVCCGESVCLCGIQLLFFFSMACETKKPIKDVKSFILSPLLVLTNCDLFPQLCYCLSDKSDQYQMRINEWPAEMCPLYHLIQ